MFKDGGGGAIRNNSYEEYFVCLIPEQRRLKYRRLLNQSFFLAARRSAQVQAESLVALLRVDLRLTFGLDSVCITENGCQSAI